MDLPIINAVMNRTRQVVSYPLEVASDAASRGFVIPMAYGLRCHTLGLLQRRPRILGLGVSSTAASAGIEKPIHAY